VNYTVVTFLLETLNTDGFWGLGFYRREALSVLGTLLPSAGPADDTTVCISVHQMALTT